MGIVIQGYTVT